MRSPFPGRFLFLCFQPPESLQVFQAGLPLPQGFLDLRQFLRGQLGLADVSLPGFQALPDPIQSSLVLLQFGTAVVFLLCQTGLLPLQLLQTGTLFPARGKLFTAFFRIPLLLLIKRDLFLFLLGLFPPFGCLFPPLAGLLFRLDLFFQYRPGGLECLPVRPDFPQARCCLQAMPERSQHAI